ncbi:hypothetical protein BE221DRAFT_148265 [Ostreococcus tauri]|uniref:Uncharacterized protein n=1 Tax=Ostreococcus tauri TaxID=70448 RepID=A0A1Y5HWU3_OSTTA|nr:hypothetical protein BE221DRAFT_196634 [Ostreococcus tauri]OUS44864.1 hypothetical protein BE221DRAFT_148265 [Ostreococcus tauri]
MPIRLLALRANGERTLVIMSYAEGLGNGGAIDEYNLNYFIRVALSGNVPGTVDEKKRVDYLIVVSGDSCTPCDTTLAKLIKHAPSHSLPHVHVIYKANHGMDFGAYHTAIKYVQSYKNNYYKYFVFLNSSLRGPFMPKWTPAEVHFTDTLTNFMRRDSRVKLVSAYVSCLHAPEPQPGPVAESLFFAVDDEALRWLVLDGVIDEGKSDKEQTILNGEYQIMRSVLDRGFKAENLLARYKIGLDWNDKRHHKCNDGRHSSRRGALEGGITVNPFETVFVKTTWCVRDAEVGIMSKWFIKLSEGFFGTEGTFDEQGWQRGISIEGTSGKSGTLVPDIPTSGCAHGDLRGLMI